MVYKRKPIWKIPILLFICGDSSKDQYVLKIAKELDIGKVQDKKKRKERLTKKEKYNLITYQEILDTLNPPYRTPIGMINNHFGTTSTKTIRKCLIAQLWEIDKVLEREEEERHSYWSIKPGINSFKKIFLMMALYSRQYVFMNTCYYKDKYSGYIQELLLKKFNKTPAQFGDRELECYVQIFAASPTLIEALILDQEVSDLSSFFRLFPASKWQSILSRGFEGIKLRNIDILFIGLAGLVSDTSIDLSEDKMRVLDDVFPSFREFGTIGKKMGFEPSKKQTEDMINQFTKRITKKEV